MSIEQVAADAVAVVQRARTLFGSSPQPPAPTEPSLESGAQIVQSAGARASVMTGDLVDEHRGFVNDATTRLTSNGHNDTALHQNLSSAALLNQTGAGQLDTITNQTRALAQAAPAARSPAAQRTLLQGLRSQVSAANTVLNTTQQQSSTLAGQIRALDYHSGGQAQGAGFGQDPLPDSPAPGEQPPHGKDPRYWIDLSKIIAVGPGEKAPYGTKQIGPGLWYPEDTSMSGPPPAKFPLDNSALTRLGPHELGPYGTKELAPGIFAPDPSYGGQAAWPPPKQPIDVRDVIHLPAGEKAPYGYVEYLPGWFAPSVPGPH
ncbi:DUF4226 domain-containing protein (plasmid) [Mycobacterium sp. Aquia_216]|uniref:DUF4226 domain-containing protein n=1 Tax=Mycobacterium sp. Aquia_216 TaxID=2991729 RepID=UPI00227B07C2|nr:DUF4226 domain-containing protein [Mycobacterium sp. Aquia_216]WAJ47949.1 DUF4226 domain-containing protein [Mycobacterium sp. Aquia_216]